MKITPIGERVLLQQIEAKGQTAGGIYIPEGAKEKRKEGIVQAVGTKEDGTALPIKAGDKVIYGGYSSEEFEVSGKKLMLIDFKDIMAKVEETQ